jgi:hypothetical protein
MDTTEDEDAAILQQALMLSLQGSTSQPSTSSTSNSQPTTSSSPSTTSSATASSPPPSLETETQSSSPSSSGDETMEDLQTIVSQLPGVDLNDPQIKVLCSIHNIYTLTSSFYLCVFLFLSLL